MTVCYLSKMRWKVCLSLLILMMIKGEFVQAKIYPYSYPPSANKSASYQVFAEKQSLFVLNNGVASITAFDIIGTSELIIKSKIDIKWVDIRPKSLGIRYSYTDSTIRITLTHSCKICIELNGKLDSPLLIFANARQVLHPNGKNKHCIYFAAGKEYDAGRIELKSHDEVFIEGGAIVHGFIEANHAEHIRIYGSGLLDGSRNQENNAYHRGIDIRNSSFVEIAGIIVSNGTTWEVVPENCEQVMIHDIKIVSHSDSDDGIDIVLSRHVSIANCFIRTKDDCIAIKSSSEEASRGNVSDISISGCTIWNGPWGNGFEIGFELESPEVCRIRFSNCDIIHIEKGAAISIHNAGKSKVHQVTYDRIRVEDARTKLFDFAIFCSQYSPDGPKSEAAKKAAYLNGAWDGVTRIADAEKSVHSKFRGRIYDILVKNVTVAGGELPFSIFYSFDRQHAVRDVRIKNLVVHDRVIRQQKNAKFSISPYSAIILQ